MEVPELTRPASPARDQPAPASGAPGAPGGQASPHLPLGSVILPPEQGLAPTVFLKALPIPLYHTVPPGGVQPRAPLLTGGLDGGSVPFILSPLLQPEGPGPTTMGKPAAPALTVNIVGTLPVLSPGLGPTLGSPGKVRNAGKYLCPHCGRDCLKPSVLEKHIRSHTGERPFPCATCGIAFKTQSNLYKHRRTQTHLNNSRLSSESDAGGGLLEEGGAAGEPSGAQGAPSGRPLSPGAPHPSPVAKNLDLSLEAAPCPGSTSDVRESPLDSAPRLPPASSLPRRKLPEPRSPTAGRSSSVQPQTATSAEKPGDAKAAEGRLRKCESTDSGYLSRSDSAEQPPAAGSPLHSLSEHSAESEGEGGPGPGRAERAAGLELEKRRLEERIARLISHNQAVVDDPQLDHVRPRKTVLSKQGSIDLPLPYTYKDSFHFDLRPPEPSRRLPAALRAARSTCTPPGRARPVFFHSVPTQLSTSAECVPVTRSNSLPFVEGTGTWQEPPGSRDACPRRQKTLSPRPAPARLANVPSGHPRALVRQVAVEDLPYPPTGDTPASAEDPDGNRPAVGEGATGRGQGASKKRGQKKPKMFSQDKWQVYGNETFKRIYQKMKASRHAGKKATEVAVGGATQLACPLQEEAAERPHAAPSQEERRTPVPGDSSVGAKPAPRASPPALEAFLVTELPRQRETVGRAGVSDQPCPTRAASPPSFQCREALSLGCKSPPPPPSGRLELGCQLLPAPASPKGGDSEAPRPGVPAPKLEGSTCGGGGAETRPQAHVVLRRPGGGSPEPQAAEDRLPSERKKLRVEGLSLPELSGAGEGTPGGPMQTASLAPQNRGGDPAEKPEMLPGSGDCMAKRGAGQLAEPREALGASSAAASGAPRLAGFWDKEPLLRPAAASQPLASGILAGPVYTAFPPQYLLRLPQEERRPPAPRSQPKAPSPQKPAQGQGPFCRAEWPEGSASFVESGLGALLIPDPSSGQAPGAADSCGGDPGQSRPWDRRKGVRGEEKGDLDTGTPAAGVPRGTASFLPTPACDFWKSEARETQQLCRSSALVRARPSGGVLNPWEPRRELGGPSQLAPEGPPSGPPAGLGPCCSRQPRAFLSALVPPGWPELASGTHSETPGSSGAQGPFPSLRAEPRLTWCCLSRSLPLPAAQKDNDASVYLALHFPSSRSVADGGPDAWPASRAASGGWTGMSPGEGGQTQTLKVPPSFPAVMERKCHHVFVPLSSWAHALTAGHCTCALLSPRYKRIFLHSRVQLRASRLQKPRWVLKKDCPPPPLKGLDPRGTRGQASSEVAGLSLSGEPACVTSESPVCGGNGEKEEEEGGRHSSRRFCPHTDAGAVRDTATPTVKEISPPACEHRAGRPQNRAVGSEFSLRPASSAAVAEDSLLAGGKALDTGSPEIHQLPSQAQVSAAATPGVFSDAPAPSSLESKGTSLRHDLATSAAALCPSPGARAGCTAPGVHSVETRDRSGAAGQALAKSPDRKALAEGLSPSPEKPSGRRISGSVPLGSTGDTPLEIAASGPGAASSHGEEGELKTRLPSGGRHGPGEGLLPCPPLGSDSGGRQGSGLLPPKAAVLPPSPGQPADTPAAPLKALRKRSLEGMRKQTRVEFSDTSSDDEDRLVIEI
uniref:Zinc finger protein 831 n=1 Tax=Catagonus wagneri TaxID=51154 RepID=A0A8C3X0A1_9CETA